MFDKTAQNDPSDISSHRQLYLNSFVCPSKEQIWFTLHIAYKLLHIILVLLLLLLLLLFVFKSSIKQLE